MAAEWEWELEPGAPTTAGNGQRGDVGQHGNVIRHLEFFRTLEHVGVSTTSGTLDTAGMSGMCGSGSGSVTSSSNSTSTPTAPEASRTGVPFDSIEIGNVGVSATPAVPTPTVSPVVGTVGPGTVLPTIPTIAAHHDIITTTSLFPCPSHRMTTNSATGYWTKFVILRRKWP